MAHKYLNKLKFHWREPYNPVVMSQIDGWWLIDSLEHPHPQWTAIIIQSDPKYHTVWGINKLCDAWATKVAELFGESYADYIAFVGHGSLPFILAMQASENQGVLHTHRMMLDDYLTTIENDLVRYVIFRSQGEGASLEESVSDAVTVAVQFREAFA